MKRMQEFIAIAALCALAVSTVHALSRGRNLKGTIVAYDPMYHGLKQASFVKNLEVTIAELGNAESSPRFVKIVFEGFGQRQLSQDILAGEKPFHVRAMRDKSCDEAHPRILSQAESGQALQASGAFLLNETHDAKEFSSVENLACYRVDVPATAQ